MDAVLTLVLFIYNKHIETASQEMDGVVFKCSFDQM